MTYDHSARVQITHLSWMEADNAPPITGDHDRLTALTELLGDVAFAMRAGQDTDGELLKLAGCAMAGVEQNTQTYRKAA